MLDSNISLTRGNDDLLYVIVQPPATMRRKRRAPTQSRKDAKDQFSIASGDLETIKVISAYSNRETLNHYITRPPEAILKHSLRLRVFALEAADFYTPGHRKLKNNKNYCLFMLPYGQPTGQTIF
jgi:hypothetical protein